MSDVEFCRFGIAIQVDGKTITSANNKEYDITKDGMEFSLKAKRNPGKATYTALTNVAEWRYTSDGAITKNASSSKRHGNIAKSNTSGIDE